MWKKTKEGLPPEGVQVQTKIDDINGCRCEQPLIYKQRLWWTPDLRAYVYYTPTHWK